MVGLHMSDEATKRGENFFPSEPDAAPEVARGRIIKSDMRFQKALLRAHPERYHAVSDGARTDPWGSGR